MSDVEFDSDNVNYGRPNMASRGSSGGAMMQNNGSERKGMIGWLIRHGIVRSENVGQTILLGVVVFNFVLAVIILKYFGVI